MEKLGKGIILFVLTIFMSMAWFGSAVAQIGITDCDGLQNIQNGLSGAYTLDNDIDCTDTVNWTSGAGFDPIGDDTNPFLGSLEGNGYTISGLTINRPNENFIGLFGKIDVGGQASNFNLDNVAITGRSLTGAVAGRNDGTISGVKVIIATNISSKGNLGGITGHNYGSIMDVHVTGQVTLLTEKGQGTGGLIGFNYGNIVDSSFDGDVLGGLRVGGAVGSNWGGTIERSYSAGTVDTNQPGPQNGLGRTGGLCGENIYGGIIIDSYSTADVTNKRDSTGGFCGLNYGASSITNAYSAGNVHSLNNYGVGGFVGENYSSTCTATFWDIDTQTNGVTISDCGAVGLPTTTMQTGATFNGAGTGAGWDFASVWKMDDYPRLQWEFIRDLGDLEGQIQDLVDDLTLQKGQGKILIKKLKEILDNIKDGKMTDACKDLGTFITLVGSLLSPSDGQAMIDVAEDVKDMIGC